MKKDVILVVGATGKVGSEISKILKAEGHQVREANSKTLNMVTGEGIKSSFEGVDKAFLVSPPGHADQYAMLSPLIQEAKRKGLKKVVLMTAMGANADENSPFRKAEIELEKSGLNYNIIRPNFFLQNFNTFWIHGIQTQDKILLPAGTAKVSFIDSRDISAVAAKLLVSSEFDNRDFDLTGSESIDHSQVAAEISKGAGRKVSYQEIKPEEFKQGLLGAGLPEAYANFLVLIFGFLREGYSARTTDAIKKITGREPRKVAQYVTDYKQAWIK